MKPTSKRRWFQYKVRTLLILVTVLSVAFGIYGQKYFLARQRMQAVDFIVQEGGFVWYDSHLDGGGNVPEYKLPRPGLSSWEEKLFGVELDHHVVAVELWKFGDEHAKSLHLLPSVSDLTLVGEQVNDASLLRLSKMKNLESLKLTDTTVTLAGVKRLNDALPNCAVERWYSGGTARKPYGAPFWILDGSDSKDSAWKMLNAGGSSSSPPAQ